MGATKFRANDSEGSPHHTKGGDSKSTDSASSRLKQLTRQEWEKPNASQHHVPPSDNLEDFLLSIYDNLGPSTLVGFNSLFNIIGDLFSYPHLKTKDKNGNKKPKNQDMWWQ